MTKRSKIRTVQFDRNRRTKTNHLRQELRHSVQEAPLMVRGLDGNILYWSHPAEEQYGWSQREALGSISHNLLSTIFPCALEEINQQLVRTGVWEGELIHTSHEGFRVKVLSRWELQSTAEGARQVVEINRVQGIVTPESAHLHATFSKYAQEVWNHRTWFALPFIICLGIIWFLHKAADHNQIFPLLE